VPARASVPLAGWAATRSFQRHWIKSALRGATFGILLAALFAGAAESAWAQNDIVSEIVVSGNRRIPAETIKARIFTKPGDIYDEAALERDFNSLWNTGYFEDIKFLREQAPKGWRLIVQVKEKPTISEINYTGLSSVSTSDVLDRFKQDKVGLSVESQYDPTRLKKAEVTIKNLLSEHGRQFATIRTEVRQIPPAKVGITFVVKEGPKVKVGKIKFQGNKNIKSRILRAAMKNLKPVGIPHSIFLENIFAKTYDATKLEEDTERVRAEYQNRGYFKANVSDPKTEIHDTGNKGFQQVRANPWISLCRLRKATSTGWAKSRSRTTRPSPTALRCGACFPSRTATSSAGRKLPKALRTCARRMANTATSTSLPFPPLLSTMRRN
jgi:outer membrane protein assembly factor BamA